MIDILEEKITRFIRMNKLGFWAIKKKLKQEGFNLDKTALLNRIKQSIWKN